MSFILEALKRADAQRERESGAVPGLHAQPLPAAVAEDAPSGRPPTVARRSVALALGLLLVLAVAVWLFGRERAVPTPASVAPAGPVATAPTATPAMPATPTAAPASTGSRATAAPAAAGVDERAAPAVTELVLPAAPPRPAEPTTRALAGVEATPRHEPGGRAEPAPAPPAITAPVATAPAAVTGAAGARAEPASAAASEPRTYTLAELPAEVRRELPTLVFGGSTYSADPARRLLIVNTQIFHENDTLAPGLTVEQIRPKSAVLKFKGYRYEIAY